MSNVKASPVNRRPHQKMTASLAAVLTAVGGLVSILGSVTGTGATAAGLPNLTGGANCATVSGRSVRDFNANGIMDIGDQRSATDVGLAGVTVSAFPPSGDLIPGQSPPTAAPATATTVTAPDGSYLLVGLDPALRYRIEFSSLTGIEQAGSLDGTQTNVRFLTPGSCTGVDWFAGNPSQYCQNNPKLVFNCYLSGPAAGSSAATLRSVKYDQSGNHQRAGNAAQTVATTAATGATWGLAYNKHTATTYSAAFVKAGSGLGPGGSSAVYATNSAGNTSVFVTLPSASGGSVPRINETSANYQEEAMYHSNPSLYITQQPLVDAVSKSGLGDLDISPDGKKLYTWGLADKQFYTIDVATGTASSVSFPFASISDCPEPDLRPFAIGVRDNGKIYVGITCTGESSVNGTTPLGSPTSVKGYVYDFDPASGAATPQLTIPMNYRNSKIPWYPWLSDLSAVPTVDPSCASYPAPLTLADQARVPLWCGSTVPGLPAATTPASRGFHPEPLLSDLSFNEVTGDLTIGIRDRYGDRGMTLSEGATLAAYNTSTDTENPVFQLESNASTAGHQAVHQQAVAQSSTVYGGEGPGSAGQFYEDSVLGCCHSDSTLGGLTQVPGFRDVVTTTMDPSPYLDWRSGAGPVAGWQRPDGLIEPLNMCAGGLLKMGKNDGSLSPAVVDPLLVDGFYAPWYVAYTQCGNNVASPNIANAYPYSSDINQLFSKANGLGDIETMCNLAPIEIGNLVWQDSNSNGSQDPNEPPLVGVTVNLYDSTSTLVASVVSGSKGEWLFSSNTGRVSTPNAAYATPIVLNSTYTLKMDKPADHAWPGVLAPLNLTTANIGADNTDNDATLITGFPTIAVTTGTAGQNNTNFDFGYIPGPGVGDYVWVDTNGNGKQDSTETGVNGVNIELLNSSGVVVAATTTAASPAGAPGWYQFDGLDELAAYTIRIPANMFYAGNPLAHLGTSPVLPVNPIDGSDGIRSADGSVSIAVTTPTGQAVDTNHDFGFAQVDVAIKKTLVPKLDGKPYKVGEQVKYQIVVTNQGTITASNIIVKDYLPLGVTITTTVSVDGSFVTTAIDGTWTVGTLNAGQTATLVYLTNAVIPGGYLNKAEVVAMTESDVDSQVNNLNGGTGDPSQDDEDKALVILDGLEIGDYVWWDINNDGAQDPGEPAIPGVTITLTGTSANGGPVGPFTKVTDTNGKYLFLGLPVGSYTLTAATLPFGAVQSYDKDGLATRNTATLQLNTDRSDADFGYTVTDLSITKNVTPGSGPHVLGQTVVYTITIKNDSKLSATGVEVTDKLPAGLDVGYLSHSASQGTWDRATGLWTVGNIGVGELKTLTMNVKLATLGDQPNKAEITKQTERDIDSVPNGTLMGVAPLSEDDNTVTPIYVIGYDVGGIIWADLNGSGLKDSTEERLSGVTVKLAGLGALGNPIVLTTTTNSSGQYLFEDLTPGSYTISSTAPTGLGPTYDKDGITSPNVTVGLLNSMDDLTYDFGYAPGDVYLRKDVLTKGPYISGQELQFNVSVKNEGVVGISGLEVTDKLPSGLGYVSDNGGGSYDPITGVWKVPFGLAKGETKNLVIVTKLTLSTGKATNTAEVTKMDQLDLDSVSANGGNSQFTHNGSGSAYGNRLGEDDADSQIISLGNADIDGTVWLDNDDDGDVNNGEFGIPGVKVSLLKDGKVVATTITDAQGNYLFKNVGVGNFEVVIDEITSESTANTANKGANVVLSKSADGSLVRGATQTWTLATSNLGKTAAAGPFTLVDVLQPSLKFISAEGDGWKCELAGRKVTCVNNTSTLAAGEALPAVIIVTELKTAAAKVVNTASIKSANSASDGSTKDNVSSATLNTSTLAYTGSGALTLAGLAGMFLLIGSGLLATTRRRDTQTPKVTTLG